MCKQLECLGILEQQLVVVARSARQPSSGASPGSPQSLSDGGIGEHCRRVRLEVEEGSRHLAQRRRRAPFRIGQGRDGFVCARSDRCIRYGAAGSRETSPLRMFAHASARRRVRASSSVASVSRRVCGAPAAARAAMSRAWPIVRRGSLVPVAPMFPCQRCLARERGGAAAAAAVGTASRRGSAAGLCRGHRPRATRGVPGARRAARTPARSAWSAPECQTRQQGRQRRGWTMQKPGHQLRPCCLCRPARFRRRRRRPVALACREGSSSSRLPGATAGALVNTTRGREEAPRGVRNSGEVGGGAAAGGGRGSVGALGGGACAWSGQTTRRRNARDSALEGRGAAQDASRRNGADLRKWPSRPEPPIPLN